MNFLIDSHMHLDMIEKYSFYGLEWYKNNKNNIISWSFFNNIKKSSQLEFYLYNHGRYVKQISENLGIECSYLTGIHPRNIPLDINLKEIMDIIYTNIFAKFCLGLGEIGLETGSPLEIVLLNAQLEMVNKIKKNIKVGIHTPKKNKIHITKKIIKILRNYLGFKNRIIIDHANVRTLEIILNEGYMAGITVDPLKINLLSFTNILKKGNEKASRIVLNSDNGGAFSIFFFNKICKLLKKMGVKICKKIYFKNANFFFELNKK